MNPTPPVQLRPKLVTQPNVVDEPPLPPLLLIGNFGLRPGNNISASYKLALEMQEDGWTVRITSTFASRPLRLCDMLWTTWYRRRSFAVAVVAVYSGPAFAWADAVGCLLRFIGKPYVATLHGGNLPTFARYHAKRVSLLLRGAVAVTSPSGYLQEQLAPYRSNIIRLPNALTIAKYPFRARSHAEPRLIWMRALHSIYNPSLALDTLALLSQEFNDIVLLMIGPEEEPGLRDSLIERARFLGVADRVQLVGGIPNADVPAWLNKGDVFLNTANIDNTPTTVLEAMACGLCVVSTTAGGLPYMISHGQNGMLVSCDDQQAMTSATRTILANQQLAETLSRQGRRTAELCDLATVRPRWREILMSAARRECVSS